MSDTILEIKEQAIKYKYNPHETPLVAELWALRGKSNIDAAEKIAERSRIPLKWIDKIPSLNGEKGTDKLMAERGVLLLRNRTSPFIEQFQHPLGRCAKFYKLTPYNNCNFWCEYCYLYLTFRTSPVSTHFVNYEKMFKELIAFDNADIPAALRVLNLGELCDPLAVEDITGFAGQLIPFAGERLKRTRLLFLTKSDNVQNLPVLPHNGKSIISFSINTNKVYHDLEHRTALPEDRLIAAQQLQNAGYEVRLRIDPVFIYEGWQEDYLDLVDMIFRSVKPSRFTIGEYRPSKGLVSHIKSRFPESSLIKINGSLINDGTKLRYPEMKRVSAFRTIIERIMQYDPGMKISLCKEIPTIWKQLDINMNGLCCNCLG